MQRMRVAAVTLGVVLGASLLEATTAWAQGGARVSGFVGTSLGEGDAAIVTGGSVGYRFTPRFGFDFEVLALPDTNFDQHQPDYRYLLAYPPSIGGIPIRIPDVETSGHTVAFLTNFVTEFPTGAKWLIPYIAGGGGVASVSRSVVYGPIVLPLTLPPSVAVSAVSPSPITILDIGSLGEIGRIERAETDLALTIGGGVDFQLAKGLAVGADLRYLHLFGTTDDLDLTRIVGRVTYRF